MSKLLKKRFIASFIFEVTVNDKPIVESGNNEEIQHYDLALLHQFLKTDQSKVQKLIGQNIALQMGTWTIDDIEKHINGIIIEDGDKDKEDLFRSTIDALPTIECQWWQEVLDDPQCSISECTENIVDCFDVSLVASQLQEAIPVKTIDALPAIEFDEVDIEDDDFAPIVRLSDEEAALTEYVSINEIFGAGFTDFIEMYRDEEKQKEVMEK
jgi:hypothetical protein